MGRPNVNWNVGIAAEKQSTYTSKAVKAGIPFASQVTEHNTKYIIKYDFDLGGETATIPDNCILDFDGGSLKNGTLVGDNTSICADIVKILGTDVSLGGTWKISEVYPEWFGASGDGETDDSISIQKAIDESCNIGLGVIKLTRATYCISVPLVVSHTLRTMFVGAKDRNYTELKAISAMDYMITSTASASGQYSAFNCSFIQLNGNRTSQIYEDNAFNQQSTALAKGGIYLPYGNLYSTIERSNLINIDGFCIYMGDSWLTVINDVDFSYSDYGVFAGGGNSFKIHDCNFSYIRKTAVLVGGQSAVLVENSFDYCGESAIVTGSASTVSIQRNYLERCSITGATYTTANNHVTSTIHAYIVHSGVGISRYANNRAIKNLYAANLHIDNNAIDNTASESGYLVLASYINKSTIKNNQFRNVSDFTMLGLVTQANYVDVHDVEITANGHNTTFFNKVKFAYNDSNAGYVVGLYNIYSNDVPEAAVMTKNLANYCKITTSTENVVTELEETYFGHHVLSSNSELCSLYFKSNVVDGSYSFDFMQNDLLENKILCMTSYTKNSDGDFTFTTRAYIVDNTTPMVDVSLPVTYGSTFPEIRVAGEYHSPDLDENITAYGNGVVLNSWLHPRSGREIKIYDNNFTQSAIIGYEGTTRNTLIVLNSPYYTKQELYTNLYYYGSVYKGIQIFDSDQPIWWNGTAWVDATGNEIDTETT